MFGSHASYALYVSLILLKMPFYTFVFNFITVSLLSGYNKPDLRFWVGIIRYSTGIDDCVISDCEIEVDYCFLKNSY